MQDHGKPCVIFHLLENICCFPLLVLKGIYHYVFPFFILLFFRFWLLGFLASWLLGFCGFLAFWLPGFWAFWLFVGLCKFWWLFLALAFRFPVPLRQVAFWLLRFCGFWRLLAAFGGFWRLWLCASSAFTVPLWLFLLLHPFISVWIWLPASSASPVPPYLNHHFFEHPPATV